MKKIFCLSIFIFLIYVSNISSQPVYNLNEEIVVTASRINQDYRDLLRNVTVIDRKTIQNFPSNSLSDILSAQIGMDVTQRGYQGMQGDISARGSSFEQVLIMIDGVKLNDSQTGHHNLDLPVNLIDIERIEIMQGHGSSLYGPGAFGGVINIITKDAKKSPLKLSASAGDFGLFNYEMQKSIGIKNIMNLMTFSTAKSNGYRYDTGFNRFTVYNKSNIDSKYGKYSVTFGYLDNDFGAYNFYGLSPSKEFTKTFLTSVNGEITRFKNVTLESKIYFRNHHDRFIYDIRKPEAFVNNHETNKIGGELVSKFNLSENQKVIIGTELLKDEIISNKLGNHNIVRLSLFSEYGNTIKEKVLLNFGIRGEHQSNYSLSWYPTLSAGYRIGEQLKLRSSIGKSFRTPSFTELYYYDPSNQGNLYLKPERGWSYEAGYDFYPGEYFTLQSNLFLRKQSEMIDWISGDAGKHWQAKNLGNVTITGIENQLKLSFDEHKIVYIKYAYTTHDFKKEYNYFSRYVFRYPVHKFSLETNVRAPFGIDNYFAVTIKKRREEKSYLVLNANFSKEIHKVICFARITNLFSEEYQEIVNVPAPGRWFEAGVKFDL